VSVSKARSETRTFQPFTPDLGSFEIRLENLIDDLEELQQPNKQAEFLDNRADQATEEGDPFFKTIKQAKKSLKEAEKAQREFLATQSNEAFEEYERLFKKGIDRAKKSLKEAEDELKKATKREGEKKREEIAKKAADVENQRALALPYAKWTLAVSLLADVTMAGGQVVVSEGVLYLGWPDWNNPDDKDDAKESLQRALGRLRDELLDEKKRDVPKEVRAVLRRMKTNKDVCTILRDADIRLYACATENKEYDGKSSKVPTYPEHSAGVTYKDIYNACIRSWSMPNRDREGRNRRYVLAATHTAFKGGPIPVGILEVGDGAPVSPQRDELMGFDNRSFGAWLVGEADDISTERLAVCVREGKRTDESKRRAQVVQERLRHIRYALLDLPDGRSSTEPLKKYSPEDIKYFEDEAAGRSRDSAKGSKGLDVWKKKRFGYLARCLQGEQALDQWRKGLQLRKTNPFYSVTRVLRDLMLPRLNLELTICGAIPPFSAALGGKLVIAHSAASEIRKLCNQPPGYIAQRVFDSNKLAKLFPDTGAVVHTTKGLFAKHSAQYERALVPGVERAIKMRKIGTTEGSTASLLSRRTYDFSQILLESSDTRGVSGIFGSGGSKRYRRITQAVRELGVGTGFVTPKIERPVYATVFVNNLKDVCLQNAEPEWNIDPALDLDEYPLQATKLWRTKWSAAAEKRVKMVRKSVSEFMEKLAGTSPKQDN